ncbi:MAG: ferredoxin [Deltaproteobacteria bacterium]|nr:ferredoxin [Deltaproteobacteria bacterium]
MKAILDTDLCEANALCMASCPEVFNLEDDDTLTILMQEIPEKYRTAVENAVRLCPRQALRIEG